MDLKKVRLNSEQIEDIETLREDFTDGEIIGYHVNNDETIGETINDMNLIELVDSLRIGYILDPGVVEGDLFISLEERENAGEGTPPEIYIVASITDDSVLSRDGLMYGFADIRKANAEEKKLFWWNKNSRTVWELRTNDILVNNAESEDVWYTVESAGESESNDILFTDGSQESFENISASDSKWRVVTFVEDRKDLTWKDGGNHGEI